jgi:hypothetical protein
MRKKGLISLKAADFRLKLDGDSLSLRGEAFVSLMDGDVKMKRGRGGCGLVFGGVLLDEAVVVLWSGPGKKRAGEERMAEIVSVFLQTAAVVCHVHSCLEEAKRS